MHATYLSDAIRILLSDAALAFAASLNSGISGETVPLSLELKELCSGETVPLTLELKELCSDAAYNRYTSE